MGDQLRDKGYDVIILNFPKLGETIDGEPGELNLPIPSSVKINGTSQTINAFDRDGGADYIERNAFLLVRLIQQVNQTLASNESTEKIVVVGPSMGGLISRYALAYMEKKQAEGVPDMDHNCRLWISFDSPHEGANIPLAIQKNLNFFGNTGEIQAAKDKFLSNLRVPAARQMLIEQTDGLIGSSPFYTTFYNSLKTNGLPGSNGFPVNVRKVTLLNGAGDGTGTYSPGVEILNGEGRKTFLNLKIFEVIDNFLPAYAQFSRVAKQRIAVKGFLSIPSFITLEYSITNPNPHGSMDASPGSTSNATEEAYQGFYEGLVDEKARQTWQPIKPLHSFIPTISALGFKNSSFDWNTRVDDRNLVCNNEIYFDNYYIPETNQEHIYLNTDNIDWIIRELDAAPSFPSGNFSIVGSNNICTSEDFSINGPTTGTTITWSATPPGLVTFDPVVGSPKTFTRTGDGIVELKATITGSCPSTVLKNDIIVGKPNISITGSSSICPNTCCNMYSTLEIPGATYNWTVTPASGNFVAAAGNSAELIAVGICTLNVSITTACGVISSSKKILMKQICGGHSKVPEEPLFTITPNPASNTVEIAGALNYSKENIKGLEGIENRIKMVSIYDVTGKLIMQKSFDDRPTRVQLDVSKLINGFYSVTIFDGEQSRGYKLMIKK